MDDKYTYQFASKTEVIMIRRPPTCNCYRVLQNNNQINTYDTVFCNTEY